MDGTEQTRSAWFGLAALTFAAVLGGCKSAMELSTAGVVVGEVSVPPPVEEGTEEQPLELRALDAYPMLTSAHPFEIRRQIRKGEAGTVTGVVSERWLTTESPSIWHVKRYDEETDVLVSEQRLYARDDGAFITDDVIKHDRGLIVELTPPKVVFPAVLRVGEEFVQDMRMRLPFVKNPSKVRASGTAQLRVTLVGTQQIRLYSGEVTEAMRTHEVFTTNLGPSKSVRTTDRWFVPGAGLVLEQWTQRVRVLGVPFERSSEVLIKLPEPADEDVPP